VVFSAACDAGVDLLITHHPLIFKAPKSIDFATPLGHIIQQAARHGVSIYSAHTNLDSVTHGINDVLAARLTLSDLVPLQAAAAEPDAGIGRVGTLQEETTLEALARRIKTAAGLPALRYCGDPSLKIRRAAVCSGSGSSLLGAFFASDADVYISGDLRYHDARDVEAAGRGLIDVGHFASEHLIVGVLTERIRTKLKEMSLSVNVEECSLESDPFIFL
jgi:dinuclear metal center YbgI/SA1388 family protein